jgi:hypothetical protein
MRIRLRSCSGHCVCFENNRTRAVNSWTVDRQTFRYPHSRVSHSLTENQRRLIRLSVMRQRCLSGNDQALLAGLALITVVNGGCSRADLAAAERSNTELSTPSAAIDSAATALQTNIPVDSNGLLAPPARESQSRAPASIEQILKSSPLRDAKADCSTPVSGERATSRLGTQCPPDSPAKK